MFRPQVAKKFFNVLTELNSMKSLSFANESNSAAPWTRQEAETLDTGLRLLAKFIASAIRRRHEEQIAGRKGGKQ
jgi:hypothetical protein